MAVLSLAACSGGTQHSVQPATAKSASHVPQTASFAHGSEIESAAIFMVSEGNNHVAFPPGALLVRTPNGIEVTYHGVKRTFSASARVDTGTYRRYAKAQ